MPETQDPKLKKLEELFKMVNESITRDEFVSSFKEVVGLLAENKKELEKEIASAFAEASQANDASFSNIKDKTLKDIQKALKEQERGMSFIYDKVRKVKDGKKGDKGDRGEPGKGIKGDKGDPGSPDTAEQVRDKLESLTDEDRLDASAIKNLPETTEKIAKHVIGTAHALWNHMDVDASGITAGQALKWDGLRWIPFTPAGGSSNSVYNESVSGSGTSWTLAHTPDSGTLRVYVNGQRLIPTTDYSLSGATITTVLSWDAGTLLADYQYT